MPAKETGPLSRAPGTPDSAPACNRGMGRAVLPGGVAHV